MICPFRNGIAYEVKKIVDTAIITKQEEYYPECYEEECPYYSYPNGCEAVNKEIGE